MNSKATRIALVTSLASLVLCFTMLMGTTLAWFVDRVENTNNRIEAGNLEVDLLMLKGDEYVSIANGSGDLFAESEGAVNNVPWQPNMTKTICIGVQNKGSLDVFYEATINVVGGGLLDVLDYKITDFGTTPPSLDEIEKAESSRDGTISNTAQNLLLGKGELKKGTKDPENDKYQNKTHYYAFTVHMKGNVSSDYQGEKIVLDIHVEAKQLSQSNISEDNTPTSLVFTEDELVETLSGTSWKLKAEVADYAFLEEKEEESDDAVFPDESIISADDTEYPLSALSIVPLGETKLLMAAPPDENEEEESVESVFVYYPKEEESKADDETASPHGWYLIGYEDIQKLLADDNATVENFTESAERIEDAEKLPIITFAESDSDILKNKNLIDWLYSNAEMQISDDGVSE